MLAPATPQKSLAFATAYPDANNAAAAGGNNNYYVVEPTAAKKV
jgi:hypothetical protein